MQKPTHFGWLDAIRGAAALYVVSHHAVMQVMVVGDHAHDPMYRILQLLTMYGHYAVDVFIVLSGYCLSLPVIAKQQFGSLLAFYLRRTVRIVLPYYAALAVSLLLITFFIGENDGSHWASFSLPISASDVFKHLLLIHQWLPNSAAKINPAFWSVGVEYQIYFLFPLFYFLAKQLGYIKTFCYITFISYALWGWCYIFNIFNPSSFGTSIYYCALFFMGMTAAHFANNPKQIANNQWLNKVESHARMIAKLAIFGILMVAVLNFVIGRFMPSLFFPLQIQSFFVGLFFSILLYLLGKNKLTHKLSTQNSFIQNKLEWIGTMGFSLYLMHDPILAMVWKYLVTPLHLQAYWIQAFVELVLGIVASVAVTVVFYHLIELPCHRLSQSIRPRTVKQDQIIKIPQ